MKSFFYLDLFSLHTKLTEFLLGPTDNKNLITKVGLIIIYLYLGIFQFFYCYSLGLPLTSALILYAITSVLILVNLFKWKLITEEVLLYLIAVTFFILLQGVYITAGAATNPTILWLALSPVVYVNLLGQKNGAFVSLASVICSIYSFSYFQINPNQFSEWSQEVTNTIMRSNLFFAPFILYTTFVYYAKSLQNLIIQNSILANRNEQLFNLIMHDIKNPLFALEACFKRKKFESVELHISYIKQILNGAKEMASKNEYASRDKYSAFKLSDIKGHILETFDYAIEKKNIAIHFNQLSPPICWGHYEQFINHIINNIVSNAIKYSPMNSKINIDFDSCDQYGSIKVTDQGTGIDPDTIERIRNGETITSKLGTSNEKGYGLGLRIALDTIDTLNGEIEFSNSSPFSVLIKLPLYRERAHKTTYKD